MKIGSLLRRIPLKSRLASISATRPRFACRVGTSWRVDETYVKIKGKWTYLYRAVDKQGKTVDFLLRAKRDVAAAKAFFRRAFKSQGRLPQKITLDGYQASHRAAREILGEHQRGTGTKIRSSKYLNNLIEQDHRSTKFRLGPMLVKTRPTLTPSECCACH